MTILAFKIVPLIITTHMYVMIARRLLQNGIHVTVFDRIATAAQKMTVHAAGGTAGPTHIPGNLEQVHIFFGKAGPGWCFFIGCGGIMTDQTVDFAHIAKIKFLILPAITDMAAGAPGPVSVQVYAKIVNGVVPFSQIGPAKGRDYEKKVDALIQPLVKHGLLGGVILIEKNGEKVFEKGYERADKYGKFCSLDTPYIVSSENRPF